MPASIIGGLISYLQPITNAVIWDGEVPRYNTEGQPINPQAVATMPTVWPALRLFMPESGFNRTYTSEDPYLDLGDITIQVWGTSRAQAESTWNTIEALLANYFNLALINVGGTSQFPLQITRMFLVSWCSIQVENVRTQASELLYRCDLHYQPLISGNLNAFP